MSTLSQYCDHPLLQNTVFFTLPPGILEGLKKLAENKIDSKLLELEEELSALSERNESQIGFWRHSPIITSLLREPPSSWKSPFLKDLAEEWGMTEAEVLSIGNVGAARAERLRMVQAGFCGWLMTNRRFLHEHAALLHKWSTEISNGGFPQAAPTTTYPSKPFTIQTADDRQSEFFGAIEGFMIRWRLGAILAPYVPFPLAARFPVTNLLQLLGHMQHGGTTFYLPDIYPVPSRDELRQALEESLRDGKVDDHLSTWTEIVRAENSARNQITRYGRVYKIQHYMRTIYSRHAEALQRKKTAVIGILASFFSVTEDTISNDMNLIAGRLASNEWYLPAYLSAI